MPCQRQQRDSENGFMHLDYQLSSAGGCQNPGFAGNHLGEYVLALTLQDRLIDITVDFGGQTRELNLTSDFIDKPLDEPNVSARRRCVRSHLCLSTPRNRKSP